jgi:two-component system, chemotaxis family, sensor kinase CheA
MSTSSADAAAAGPADGPAPHTLPADMARELFPEFVAEALDHLEQLERALLRLEAGPGDTEALNIAFRAFHTIKGTSSFFGLQPITEISHSAESMLCVLRDVPMGVTAEQLDLVLHCADAIREMLSRFESIRDGAAFVAPAGHEELMRRLAYEGHRAAEVAGGGASVPRSTEPGDRKVRTSVGSPAGATGTGAQRQARAADAGAATLRVSTARLDALIELVGELVVAQSLVTHDPLLHRHRHDPIAGKVARAGKLVRELQELSMSLRMVPLQPLFHRMERLVRDVARESGRKVELVTAGAGTEIDRSMVDQLADPLVHMVRNALHHGIEAPDARIAAGKAAAGTLRLSAWHAGGDVMIELADDGRGLDHDLILERAVARGLVDDARDLTARDVWNLICEPGLTTTDAVTELSGRGVGMDVVKRNIEALRGRIEIDSEAGRGTTFLLRLPLTLAVMDGMLVRVGRERYVVPTADIRSCFRPGPGTVTALPGGGAIVTRNGAVMPVIPLYQLLGAADAVATPEQALVVAVGRDTHQYGLLVDELLGQHQFVTRPLAGWMGASEHVAGTTILGDGHAALILDIAGVLATA